MFFSLFSSLVVASSCPDLSGTYSCPADGLTPVYDMTISQEIRNDGETEYTHTSHGNSSSLVASDDGIQAADNSFAICIHDAIVVRRDGSEYYHKLTSDGLYKVVMNVPGGHSVDVFSCRKN